MIVMSNKIAKQLYYGDKNIIKAFAGNKMVYADPDVVLWRNKCTPWAIANGKLYGETEEMSASSDWVDAGLRKDGTAYVGSLYNLVEIDNGGYWKEVQGDLLLSKDGEIYASYTPPTVKHIDTSDVYHAPWETFVSHRLIKDSDGGYYFYPGETSVSVVPITLPYEHTEINWVGRASLYSSAPYIYMAGGNLFTITYDYNTHTANFKEFGNLNDGKWSKFFANSVGLHDGELMSIEYEDTTEHAPTIIPLKDSEYGSGIYPDVPDNTRWVSVAGNNPALRIGSTSSDDGSLFAVNEQGELWCISNSYGSFFRPVTAKFPGNNWHAVIAGYSIDYGYIYPNYTYAITAYGEIYYVSNSTGVFGDVEFDVVKLG